MKENCWEVMDCGRGPGGEKVAELGLCPAATESACDGLNGGKNAGRLCWAVSGTFCGGRVQGTFAEKEESCAACDFFNQVKSEEGLAKFFWAWKKIHKKQTRKNCWEVMECGRGPDGGKVVELGVCAAATDAAGDGLNGGTNSGRICWAVTGTLCGGTPQGTFADKKNACGRCSFFRRVKEEEGTTNFIAAWKTVSRRRQQKNCWEVKACGREPGGVNVEELGECPAAMATACDGLNGGTNAGRICWAVTGTFCGGKVQGTFAEKERSCLKCDFYARVRSEEGSTNFLNSWQRVRKLSLDERLSTAAARTIPAGVRHLKDQQWVTVDASGSTDSGPEEVGD